MRARWLGFAALLFAACALNPVTGRPELVLISAERERALGAEQEQQFLAELGTSDHAESTRWVEEIGARLAQHSPRQDVGYRFHVVDLPEPNAFALPGGPVFVTRGLLALARSEDELAGVIGHEIGHVAARHSVQQRSAATPLALLFGVPAAIVGSVSQPLGTLVALPGALVSGLALSAYGREQEHEADEVAARLAAAAGYRPLSLADYLERLEREAALHGAEPPPLSFFASHPRTPDRVARVRSYAEQLVPDARPASAGAEATALATLDGLLVGENPAHGVFVGDDFLHVGLGFTFRIPAGWERENRPDAVVAVDPNSNGRAALLLELAGEGNDAVAVAKEQITNAEQRRALQKFEVNGRRAAQLEVVSGGEVAQLTWLAVAKRVYRIAGVYPIADAKNRRRELAAVVESLHVLSEQERARVRAARLRVRETVAGESVAALVTRTQSAWSAAEVAVANDLAADARLAAGARVKVAVEERFAGKE